MDPDDADLNHAAGLWEQLCGQSMAALKYFRRAIAARPDVPRAYLGAASVCRQQGLYDQAEEYARAGLAQSADPQLRYELGLALAGRGRLDDAIQH
ncbi:MAG: tetratricopeptide repeat protein, partial [Phycisphaerales bacterium]